jgi:hypothetical protein
VNFVHFMAKHFRHQDTKMNFNKGFLLWLYAFVAIFSGLSGLGYGNKVALVECQSVPVCFQMGQDVLFRYRKPDPLCQVRDNRLCHKVLIERG